MIAGKLSVGLVVGCEYRWPMHASHPDCWQPPLKGVVLALDDLRAWHDSIAFPTDPTQDECTAHVESCLARNLLKNKVPVRYSIGKEQFIEWDMNDKLHPWEEELKRWNEARKVAYDGNRRTVSA